MSASSIQAKVKAGLKKAVAAIGAPDDLPIYLLKVTQSGTPLAPATSETLTLLPDALFQSYEQGLNDPSIKSGDRLLVSNSDVKISQNDTIKQGDKIYLVVSVSETAPTGTALVYKSQVRQQ